MSNTRPASSVHAVHVSDQLPVLASLLDCPTSKLPFRAHPLVFGCDHSMSPECADAMRASGPAAVLCDTLECIARFKLAVDKMLVQAEEYRKRWLMEVQLLGLEREKALGAQTDLLDVSAGQLRACVALGRAAVASGEDAHICEAAQTAKAMEGLLTVPTWFCTGTHSAVHCDLSAALACLEGATRLQHFEVDAAQSSVAGNGLTAYANDGVARNVIRVTCMDSAGELADWVTLKDAEVGMTVNGATWRVASAAFTEPGVVEVAYVVEEGGAEEMEVGVSLRGVTVPGGPWRPHAGFMAKGVHIATLLHMGVSYNSSLAVSLNGNLMVLSNPTVDELAVYQTEGGSHVRFQDYSGTGGGFWGFFGLCTTAHDTVLVADLHNKRIQEFTLEGEQVKFIPVGKPPYGVAVHGDLLAVAAVAEMVPCLQLYNYTTGALLREIPSVKTFCMCFSPDGKQLAVGGYDGPITLMSVDGQFLRHIGLDRYWQSVAFTCTGDVLGVDQLGGMLVFSATDGMLLRSWGTKYGSGGTVSGNRLYAMHDNRVLVYE